MKLIIFRLATPGFNTPSLRDLFAKQIVEFEIIRESGISDITPIKFIWYKSI